MLSVHFIFEIYLEKNFVIRWSFYNKYMLVLGKRFWFLNGIYCSFKCFVWNKKLSFVNDFIFSCYFHVFLSNFFLLNIKPPLKWEQWKGHSTGYSQLRPVTQNESKKNIINQNTKASNGATMKWSEKCFCWKSLEIFWKTTAMVCNLPEYSTCTLLFYWKKKRPTLWNF